MADRPDLDLTGAAISSTFQHLLQIREDDKTLYDALGNHLDDFRLSGSFTTSEFLEIEDETFPPFNSINFLNSSLEYLSKTPETIIDFPVNFSEECSLLLSISLNCKP